MIKTIKEYFKKKKERKQLMEVGMQMGNNKFYSEYVIDCYLEKRNEEINY